MKDESNWVRLYSSPSEILITLLKSKLHNSHIPAVEMRKKDTVYNVIGDIELMIPSDDLEEALIILRNFEEEGSIT